MGTQASDPKPSTTRSGDCLRLYEQGADVVRLQAYGRRWWQWVTGGLELAPG